MSSANGTTARPLYSGLYAFPELFMQTFEETLTSSAAQTIASSLEFFSWFLGSNSIAQECKLAPVLRFLCQALSGHQAAVIYDLNENN